MGQFVFNISKGRTVEYHERVNNNDPANSAIILVVLAEAGLESDDVLRDYDTVAAILAASNNEPTNTNYARKTLTDSDLAPVTVDDVNDLARLTYPTQTWTSVAAGDSWRKILECYDPDTTGGTDSSIIPIAAHDMLLNGAAIIPSGANIVWSIPNGYVVAR